MSWDMIILNVVIGAAGSLAAAAILKLLGWRTTIGRQQKADGAARLADSIAYMGGSREKRIEFMLKSLYTACFFSIVGLLCVVVGWVLHGAVFFAYAGPDPIAIALGGASISFLYASARRPVRDFAAVVEAETHQRDAHPRPKAKPGAPPPPPP